jgi:hypothetical protein
MKRLLRLVAVSAFVVGCSTVTTYPQTSVTEPSAAATLASTEASDPLSVGGSFCAGLVLAAVFRADEDAGPGGALEVIDTAAGASRRFAAEWPDGYHLAPVSGAVALVGADGSVAARDGDRFPGLEVCDMEQGVIRIVGFGPLPGVSPEVAPSQVH